MASSKSNTKKNTILKERNTNRNNLVDEYPISFILHYIQTQKGNGNSLFTY